ncbi:MAG: NAD(P)H-binding protein [Actinomycetota bacterium]|nr:NAD(P)H-binding protein [Actinomycetota bacterium]
MPVVVTGADAPLGRAVALALAATGSDVRATVRSRAAVADLLAQGVRTAVSDLVDPLRLGAVLENAHTVVHLDGLHLDSNAPLATLDLVVDAAEDTSVRRLVTVAPAGAALPAMPPYEVVLVRTASPAPRPALVAALLAADARAAGHGSRVVDVDGPPDGADAT